MQFAVQHKRSVFSQILVVAALLCTGASQSVGAQRDGAGDLADATEPLVAVVALTNQRVSIYAGAIKILQAPVSTGRKDYETPAGIYSVIEKNRDHYSNLYDDAAMPFMQRLTWSGIALHAGALPGYPASHGCIRMPSAFAEQLFDLSKIGMRVVVVREDIKPVEITHSRLFQPGPIVSEEPFAAAGHGVPPGQERVGHTWRSIAAAKAKSAAIASATAKAAALAASKARTEAAPFMRKMRIAQGAKLRAEALLRQAESALEAAGTPEAKEAAETLKAQALEHLATAQEDLETLTTEGQAKIDAAAAARDEVKSAEVARVKAYDDVRAAEAKLTPVSVFVSRSTQRLYVRQGFQPIFESPVTISHPEEPIGTIIFAAVGSMHDGSALRWTALSMYAAVATDNLQSSRRPTHRNFGPANTDIGTVKQALERIDIPSETIDRIREIVSPRSSLIISDEPVSRETSKGTDFIILMSGEPQGGIKMRPRDPFAAYRSYRYPRPRPYSESYSPFWR